MCGTDVTGYVSEGPGLSAYALSNGAVYRTYVTTARGLEPAMAYYALLDRTPRGRDEKATRSLSGCGATTSTRRASAPPKRRPTDQLRLARAWRPHSSDTPTPAQLGRRAPLPAEDVISSRVCHRQGMLTCASAGMSLEISPR